MMQPEDGDEEEVLVARAIAQLLDEFYMQAGDVGAVDWKRALDAEELLLKVCNWGALDAKIEAVTYLADQVTQLGPPHPFNALRCAAAVSQALNTDGR